MFFRRWSLSRRKSSSEPSSLPLHCQGSGFGWSSPLHPPPTMLWPGTPSPQQHARYPDSPAGPVSFGSGAFNGEPWPVSQAQVRQTMPREAPPQSMPMLPSALRATPPMQGCYSPTSYCTQAVHMMPPMPTVQAQCSSPVGGMMPVSTMPSSPVFPSAGMSPMAPHTMLPMPLSMNPAGNGSPVMAQGVSPMMMQTSPSGQVMTSQSQMQFMPRQVMPANLPTGPMGGNTHGPMPSGGSANHDGTGKCSPCAWYWKPRGCQSGVSCGYCHLCPEGELKNRKKAKVAAIRMGAIEPAARSSPGAGGSHRASLKLTALI